MAMDGNGVIYVADSYNGTIRKMVPSGTNWIVTTLAGQPGVLGTNDGFGGGALFYSPNGVAVDPGGNVYVSDSECTIRMITPAGRVSTIAGQPGASAHLDGTNGSAQFAFPLDIAVDSNTNIYVIEYTGGSVRKVSPVGTNWVVTTVATGFYEPQGLAVDAAGNIYVADTFQDTIYQLTPSGTNWISTLIAGKSQTSGSADGANVNARFFIPYGISVDGSGNVFVADNGNNLIREISPAGGNWIVTTIAGLTNAGFACFQDGTNSGARFLFPSGVLADKAGNVFVGDTGNNTIRKLSPQGTNWVSSTIAGLAVAKGSIDGTNSSARFSWPSDAAVDVSGNIYVVDASPGTIRRVSRSGNNWIVTTIAGNPSVHGTNDGIGTNALFYVPSGLVVDLATNIYVTDTYNHTVRKISPVGGNWLVTTVAGHGGAAGSTDATGSAARFNQPTGVRLDGATNLYVADTYNQAIRKITPSGVVTTIAKGAGFSFNYPNGVAVDSATNVYVADTYNNTIRRLTQIGTNWTVTTLGGASGVAGFTDGTNTIARFYQPVTISIDLKNNLFITDYGNQLIRKMTPQGANWIVTTIAGSSHGRGKTDGTGNIVRFLEPNGIVVDGLGNVYVADLDNSAIRMGWPENVPATIATTGAGFGFNGGQFGFILTGPPGQLVVVETSPDLKNWQPIWTNTFGTGALTFTDPQSTTNPAAYYRARTP